MSGTEAQTSPEAGSSKSESSAAKRAREEIEREKRKRTYRACLPCRSRKLRCDLGDSNAPTNGPCARCRRESRDCVFTVKPGSRTYTEGFAPEELQSRPPPPPPKKSTAGTPTAPPDPTAPHGQPSPSAAGAPHPAYPGYADPSVHEPYVPATFSSYLPPHPQYPGAFPPAAGAPPYTQVARPPLGARAYSHPNGAVPERLSRIDDAGAGERRDRGSSREYASSDEEGEDDDEAERAVAGVQAGGSASQAGVVAGERSGQRGHLLLTSTVHNPSDALRMLATASASAPRLVTMAPPAGAGPSPGGAVEGARTRQDPAAAPSEVREAGGAGVQDTHAGGWSAWQPVVDGVLTQDEGEALLDFFNQAMSPLYPLLSPNVFAPEHLPSLCSTESFLLLAILSIAARYATNILDPARAAHLHTTMSYLIRAEQVFILDGSNALRHVSTVEALLLLVEWPTVPIQHGRTGTVGDKPGNDAIVDILRPSNQYDAASWSLIGCAVRLGQELGIHNANLYVDPTKDEPAPGKKPAVENWVRQRYMRTWTYTYNADRHVAVRLGRNTSAQHYMSSSWWETVTTLASDGMRGRGKGEGELWGEDGLSHGFQAALVGVIQDRLYPNHAVTRALLRTGHYEAFLRSLDTELTVIRRKSRETLKQKDVQSTLLQIEICYITLYGNAVSLRALQERLRRRQKAGDFLFIAPSLLNLQEGPWIIDALAAAQSILQLTVTVLAPKGFLRLCPSRIFQRILFAATLLFKGLACGVVEFGAGTMVNLLDETIKCLHASAIDSEHLPAGFAALLARIQSQCEPTLLSGPAGRVPPQTPGPTHPRAELAPAGDAPAHQPAATAFAHTHAHAHPSQPLPPSAMASAGVPGYDPAHPLPTGAAGLADLYGGATGGAGVGGGGAGGGYGGFGLAGGAGAEGGWDHLPWNFDPSNAALAAGHEQDRLFSSLWSTSELPGSNPALSLFGTLVGEDFGFEV